MKELKAVSCIQAFLCVLAYSIQGHSVMMISPSSESHQQVVAVGQPLAVQPQGTVMVMQLGWWGLIWLPMNDQWDCRTLFFWYLPSVITYLVSFTWRMFQNKLVIYFLDIIITNIIIQPLLHICMFMWYAFTYVYICWHICIGHQVCTCVCVCLPLLLHIITDSGFLSVLNEELSCLSRLPSLHLPMAGVIGRSPCPPNMSVGYRDMNSSPHTHMANILLREPSLQL